MEVRKVTVSLFVAAILAIASAASVAQAAKEGNEAPMRITNVQFSDLGDASQIEILGSQFDNGGSPVVTLDGAPIVVWAASATRISAELPNNTADGDYTIGVSTGTGAKQSAEHTLTVAPLVRLLVGCVDWFRTTGDGHHIHIEMFLEDEFGDPVNGATANWEMALDGDVFQEPVSGTTNHIGRNKGAGCEEPPDSGVTGWFCCVGSSFEPDGAPGKKSCPRGIYDAFITSIDAPPGTTLVWDGVTPFNATIFDYEEQ